MKTVKILQVNFKENLWFKTLSQRCTLPRLKHSASCTAAIESKHYLITTKDFNYSNLMFPLLLLGKMMTLLIAGCVAQGGRLNGTPSSCSFVMSLFTPVNPV